MNRLAAVILLGFVLETVAADKPEQAALDFFEKKVRPVLVEHCYGCHSVESKKERGGLLLDSKESLLKGGDSGSAIVPGKPNDSLLIKHVRWTGDRKMPPKEKLPDNVIADLEKWIGMGAPDPRTGKKVVLGIDYNEGRKHWAYQPVKPASPPTVKNVAWPKNDIDRYILSKIEAKGLTPAADAAKEALLRRVTFDLTGLPPTPEEVEAARNDKQDDWYEKVVDRLLKSKEYGVHRARHWLDGVRYNPIIETVDHYRDWLIRAFNDDVPYDQFVTKQIAGDLLSTNDPKQHDDNLTATQLLILNRNEMDLIEGVIEVVGQQFLGVSINCAKCHDHKFDAYSQHDYYALAGVFTSTAIGGKKKGTLAQNGIALKTDKDIVLLACKDDKAADTNLLLKGDPKQKGEVVPRRLPYVLVGEQQKPLGQVTKGSGRLEVAKWIASAENPLTARVMANRLWMHLFGQGIVATPNDFGTQGEKPTHPELLDHLAVQFVKSGWSVKALMREIVLSRTYRQSSRTTNEVRKADLENALYTRMPMKRLQYEQILDSLHFVAGRLDLKEPEAHGRKKKAKPNKKGDSGESSPRAIYLGDSTTTRIFDGADPDLLTEKREASVTGPQMLFFLNNQRVVEMAGLIAARAEKGASDVKAKVKAAFVLLYGRSPTDSEIEMASMFLKGNTFVRYCHALLGANEFLYVE